MNLAEKLIFLRKKKGYSQEALADKLHVSRQAITKWENSLSYPDIDNLIELSKIFAVTIDYLVKEEECIFNYCPKENIDIAFLIKAKINTYASEKSKVASSRPFSHDYRFGEGNLLYIDTYLGGNNFAGTEAMWKDNLPLYSMNYCGRVIGENFSGDFLKAALRQVPYDEPYRGPAYYKENKYTYVCHVDGNLDWFQGYEEILFEDVKIYECFFHGGKII